MSYRTVPALFRHGLVPALLLIWAGVAGASPDIADPHSYVQPEVRSLVALVNAAAAKVERQGTAAFAAFRLPGRWLRPREGLYLFVFDMRGTQVVNAGFPDVEGLSRLDWRDDWGKPVFRLAIDKLDPRRGNRSHWWVHYLWPRPGETKPSWKSTYIARARAPDGTVYGVAAGLYGLGPEKAFIELLVGDAAELIRTRGARAFARISSRSGEFMFHDSYVFVLREDGVQEANAAFPGLIGKNLLTTPGFAERDLVASEIRHVRAHGGGWLQGRWPRPGESTPERQQIYLLAVQSNGVHYLVGSGIYAERGAQPR